MNQHPLTDKNRLSINYPELCKEWDYEKNYPLRPEDVSYASNKIVCWECYKGHKWNTSPNTRTNVEKNTSRCPYCGGHKASIDNCLATLNPLLAKEWHPTKNGKLTPHNVTCGSERKVWWICSKGHEWMAFIKDRHKRRDRCPYCCNHGSAVCSDNCLATLRPDLAKEWHPTRNGQINPLNIRSNSNKKFWWICSKCQEEWFSSVLNRNNGESGCPFCKKIGLLDGVYCASMTEAYVYLKLKGKGTIFSHDEKYGLEMGNSRYDFYIPATNTYIEVTSFSKNNSKNVNWFKYLRNIVRKKKYVLSIGANFRFIRFTLNRKQKRKVRLNMK